MKKTLIYISIALAVIASLFIGSHYASAMASIFMAPTKTAAATSTVSLLQVGMGTTTISLATPLSMGMSTKYDMALVMFEVQSTTSPGRIGIRVEHSLDGVDWFSEAVRTTVNATSSSLVAEELIFNMASTSSYILNGTTSRMHQSFYIETPTPHNRVVFYMPRDQVNLNLNLGLWAAVQPIKEVQVLNQ